MFVLYLGVVLLSGLTSVSERQRSKTEDQEIRRSGGLSKTLDLCPRRRWSSRFDGLAGFAGRAAPPVESKHEYQDKPPDLLIF
jgi:hypothetical protein